MSLVHDTGKLRAEAAASWRDGYDITAERLEWAADRIDALEAALRKIANAEAGPLGRQGIAREALGDTDA